MSHETRPSASRPQTPEKPKYAPDFIPDTDEEEQKPSNHNLRRKLMLGAGAFGVATTAATLIFMNQLSNAVEEGLKETPRTPRTSAPEVPGTTEPSVEPTKEQPRDSKYENLTPTNFPFIDIEGKKFEGQNEFVKSLELRVEDYDDETIHELPGDALELMSEWIASGSDTQTRKGYEDFTAKDRLTGGAINGTAAVAQEFYDPAYKQALTGEFTDTYINNQLPENHLGFLNYAETDNALGEYKGEYKLVKLDSIIPNGDNVTSWIRYKYEDNVPGNSNEESTVPATIQFTKATGIDGQLVWKISKYVPENSFAPEVE